jgi:hypothetical protein
MLAFIIGKWSVPDFPQLPRLPPKILSIFARFANSKKLHGNVSVVFNEFL